MFSSCPLRKRKLAKIPPAQQFPVNTFFKYFFAVPARRYTSSTSVASLSLVRYCGKKRVICSGISAPPAKEAEETVGAVFLSPEVLADKALACKPMGNIGVAFTYNEPLVGWEYVRDTAKLVKEAGMDNVLVTNGSASLEVLEEILPFIDAMNIDLKGFNESYYEKLGGDLESVKRFIARASEDCHVELTTLIVPGENDSVEEMEEEAGWIASLAGGAEMPLHITRFFPQYRIKDKEATDVEPVSFSGEASWYSLIL